MLIEHIPPEERRKSMNLEQIEGFILQEYRDEKITEGSAAMLLGLDRIDLRFLAQTYDFDLVLARRIAPGLKKSVDEVVQMIKASKQKIAKAGDIFEVEYLPWPSPRDGQGDPNPVAALIGRQSSESFTALVWGDDEDPADPCAGPTPTQQRYVHIILAALNAAPRLPLKAEAANE